MVSINTEFDRLLGGGLVEGVLTQVYGPSASGKTNLALIATANASKEGKVVYIDSEGGFSTERLKQIVGSKMKDVLGNVLLVEPASFDEQKVAVQKLSDLVPNNSVSLVVVDGIAMLYRLEEDRDIKVLGRQLAQLLRIARKHKLPVLMTNQVYTDIDTGRITPVGGVMTEYWCKVIVELVKEGSQRYAVVRKHLFMPEGLTLQFRIVNEGILPLKPVYVSERGRY